MSRAGEFAGFLCVAALVHVGLWAGVSRTGSTSAGSGGEATLSLMAASGDMTEMVATWARPVDVMQEVSELSVTPITTRSDIEMPSSPQAMPPEIPPLDSVPIQMLDALPQMDTSSVRPAVMKAAPQTSLRPQDRPNQPAATPSGNAAREKAKTIPQKPATQPQSSGASAQTAAGSGSGQNAGAKTVQRSASLSKAARQNLLAEWGASIRNRVERRKRYPRGARVTGTTILRITISSEGQLIATRIAKSSGSEALDQAAKQAVSRARFPSAPAALDQARYHFNLPLAFTQN